MTRPRRGLLRDLALGRYQPGDSPLHQSPVWGKAALLAVCGAASFWLESASAFAAMGAGLAMLARLAGLSQALFWRSLRPLLLLAAFAVLAGAFLNHPGATLTAPEFSWAGLHTGALYAARLLLITLLTTLFFLTTLPEEAISLGVRLLAPLRLLGIASKELSLLVHLAYRFVPLLARELDQLERGRRARNLRPALSPLARLRQATDTIVTVIIGAIHRAEVTGLAIEQRGVLESWQPRPLGGGRQLALWPLLLMVAMTAGMVVADHRLL